MKDNLNNIRREISELKKQLNELNVEKEKWFSIKEKLKKDVSELITKIKTFKSNKDKSDKELQKLKERRDSYNKNVQELIKEFKELNSKKQRILKEKKINFNPSDIIKKIEDLEFKLETEAISFEKEQNIMKQTKTFKKQLSEIGEAQDIFKQLKNLSEKITETKNKADDSHNQMKKVGKTTYHDLMEMSKQINELKKKQEDAFKNFIQAKDKFSKINEELKNKLKSTRELNLTKSIMRLEKQEKEINEKVQQVKEKLKKNKKLTTEDLLILQEEK